MSRKIRQVARQATSYLPPMINRRWLPTVIVDTMDRIESDLAQPWSLGTMAAISGFSPHHFHRKFQDATGETPVAFLERLRLERAALLLLASQDSITEMAWKIGYRNPETFARRFTRHFGVAARDYRRHQLALWTQLGFKAGRDPMDGPGTIQVCHVPEHAIAIRRSLGDDLGFSYSVAESAWNGTAPPTTRRYGVTLDYPGITDPGRVRQDWGLPLPDTVPSAWTCRRIGGGSYAQLQVQQLSCVPNVVYQRLFVWSLAGRYRLRPGPVFETWHNDDIIVNQPVTDFEGD